MQRERSSTGPREWRLRGAALGVYGVMAAALLVSGCDSGKKAGGSDLPKVPLMPQGSTGPTSGGTPPPPKQADVPPAQVQIENVAILKGTQGMPALAVKVRNTGTSTAEMGGACGWTCPVKITQISGFLQVSNGEYVPAGQEKTLDPGGGINNVCDGNKLPVTLSCSFDVQTVDAQFAKVGGAKELKYQQTVTPP